MIFGMMWFDGRKNVSIEEKIKGAIAYYQKKYQKTPDICHMNPKEAKVNEAELDIILVRSNVVMQNNFWLGIIEDE